MDMYEKMKRIRMPEAAERIIRVLQEAGFEAYIVGGCVRDAVLGRMPDDWDITTSARPEEVKALFRRTIDTGIAHGTVTVMMGDTGYEVTTYRVDGKYSDHRRPETVTFTASLKEDMQRRDFTINAMAYNDEEGVIDHFGGMEDLEAGCIRCVGEPSERFDEDALRMLRAVRFAAQLDFSIDGRTREAIRAQAGFLREISAERIHTELDKLLLSGHPARLKEAYELGITGVVMPEFDRMMETPQHNPHHCYSVGEHSLRVVEEVPAGKALRWAALLHDVAKPAMRVTDERGDHFYGHSEKGVELAEEILKRLKFDNATADRIKRLVLWHDYGMGQTPSLCSFRKALSRMGADLFEEYALLKRADILAQSDYMREQKLLQLEKLQEYYAEVMHSEQCLTLKDLKVTGRDLMELGMQPGKQMGEMLQYLLESVLEDPEKNERQVLLGLTEARMRETAEHPL